MSTTIIWFILTLIFIIVEMMLGTLYLFALALGALVAGILSYFEYTLETQSIIAGIVTIIGAIGFYFLKRKHPTQDKDDNLDIGQRVVVNTINEDGSANVNYRGAMWKALAKEGELSTGIWQINSIKGINLILDHKVK